MPQPVPVAATDADAVHVARQPILDRTGRVFGYELLYREAAWATSCTVRTDMAGARVLTDAVLGLGLETLTGGLPAFINFSRQLVIDEAALLVPPQSIVLEVLEDMTIDDQVVEACRRLHARGYALALDDFVAGSDAEVLLPYARFVKVDVLTTPAAERRAIARRLSSPHVRLIAEKVESADVKEETSAEGYSLFQGFYFCRPTTLTSEALPARRVAYVNLLGALSDRNLTIDALEQLVKRDASLSVRVLRSVNSAAFQLHQRLQSVRQALVLLGLDQIRKWASVWALAEMNDGGTPEIATTSVLRARCCEILGSELLGPAAGSGFFLLGLCSLLDAILRRPMAAALADIPLPVAVHDALLGTDNVPRRLLDAVIAYQTGDWTRAEAAAEGLGLPPHALPAAYRDAIRWADATTKI